MNTYQVEFHEATKEIEISAGLRGCPGASRILVTINAADERIKNRAPVLVDWILRALRAIDEMEGDGGAATLSVRAGVAYEPSTGNWNVLGWSPRDDDLIRAQVIDPFDTDPIFLGWLRGTFLIPIPGEVAGEAEVEEGKGTA